jgi:IS1 family transposase
MQPRASIIMDMNKLSVERRARIPACLCEALSVRATCRLLDCSKDAVLKLVVDAGEACVAYHDGMIQGVTSKRVQVDEVWSFVHSKAKNVPEERRGQFGFGDVWTWTAIDADSKLILSYLCGGRDAEWACRFMEDLASRVTTRIQLTTDGHKVYAEAVEGAFGMQVDYAMLIKLFGAPGEVVDGRYSPAKVIGIRTAVLSGNPDPDHISTSFVERQNLSLRMSLRRFTRLTNAFSKKFANHCHAVAIYYAYYNFCRVHQTLRVTPAMESGLADHVWSLEELVGLLREKALQATA